MLFIIKLIEKKKLKVVSGKIVKYQFFFVKISNLRE